jgi:hypothetical protein
MFWIAAFVLGVGGELSQPIGWLALVGGVVIGFARRPFRWALLLALVVAALEFALQHTWWTALAWPSRAGLLFGVFAAICGGGWLMGRAIAYLIYEYEKPHQGGAAP